MTYESFDLTVTDRVAHLRLSRPERRNAFLPATYVELGRAVEELSRSAGARALVLSSTGKHFTAGMDLSVFTDGQLTAPPDAEPARRNAFAFSEVRRLQRCFASLEQARFPVIAAVQGGVLGAGVDLVCAADLRYASADAWFCVQETNVAITADLGTLQRLGRQVPEGVARELVLTGRRMPAQRAYEVGLVQAVLPDHDAVVAHALATAAEIAEKSPLAVWGAKASMNYARDHSVADGLDQVATWQAGMMQTRDVEEAIAARLAQRPPVYDDLLPESS
jgi:enoyl-CoA hydratase